MAKEDFTIPRRPGWEFKGEIKVKIECDPASEHPIKLGLAIKAAIKKGLTLDGARLDGARLDGARLDGASLDGASLVGASLVGASLVGASLVGASLVGASLDGASLVGASLDGARLDGARLDGARLVGASLDGARLVGARLDGARLGDGIVIKMVPIQLLNLDWPVTIFDSHMRIGCQFHSLHDWANFDDRTIADMDSRKALRFWRAYKDMILGVATTCGRTLEPFIPVTEQAA